MNYANLAFTDAIKKIQEEQGSREAYERMERKSSKDGFTEVEQKFIGERDSFYMATIGENGFPYIQFRGGPRGFLKVLDEQTLAFIDFRGNMQYISVGNLQTNNKVALILLDYPNRTRLKIYAEASIVGLNEQPELIAKLQLENYEYRPARALVLNVKAFDWNCPQHITPRYTAEEIESALEPQRAFIRQLEAQIQALQAKNE